MKRPTPARKRVVYLNAKGQRPDPTLVPVDLHRCQCFPNMMRWSPLSFGPKPRPLRCENTATHVIVENRATHDDGRIGAMSVCDDCLALFRQHRPPTFAKIHKIGGNTHT